ncbi:hypothetical protein, partial [Klebsiella pneumoniae]|uniref:hypothetical protein n=1 Tax=Klebsiella pneumoniae TaxID=573 RepID=UPI00272F043D
NVATWRDGGYQCTEYPVIAEILNFATTENGGGELRYLRRAQFRALETYWYLRLAQDTPTIPQLYEKLFPKLGERLAAMGVS